MASEPTGRVKVTCPTCRGTGKDGVSEHTGKPFPCPSPRFYGCSGKGYREYDLAPGELDRLVREAVEAATTLETALGKRDVPCINIRVYKGTKYEGFASYSPEQILEALGLAALGGAAKEEGE